MSIIIETNDLPVYLYQLTIATTYYKTSIIEFSPFDTSQNDLYFSTDRPILLINKLTAKRNKKDKIKIRIPDAS